MQMPSKDVQKSEKNSAYSDKSSSSLGPVECSTHFGEVWVKFLKNTTKAYDCSLCVPNFIEIG